MLIPLEKHPIYRAHELLARATGGMKNLPPNIQRMDLVAEIFGSSIQDQTEASAASAASTASEPAHTRLQPRNVFRVPSAACRDFDPFITADLGEWMARTRHVLSLVLGHPNCTDEDRRTVANLWQWVRDEVEWDVLFIRDNKDRLCAAWEAGRPYLGPDTMAGRARMRKEQATMASGLEDDSSGKPDNAPKESNAASASSSFSSTSTAAAPAAATASTSTTATAFDATTYAALDNMRKARLLLREQNRRLLQHRDAAAAAAATSSTSTTATAFEATSHAALDNMRKAQLHLQILQYRNAVRQHSHTSPLTAKSATEGSNLSHDQHGEASMSSGRLEQVGKPGIRPQEEGLRRHQFEQNSTPPGSFSPGHKAQCVEDARSALGALSLSEQNRRNNKTPTPERVHQDRHENYGYKLYASDMGNVSTEDDDDDDDEDNDRYEQGQDQLQHRYPFEYQEEERRLGDQLPQVGDRLLHDFRRQAPYHQQQQQPQQQQHLDPSGHQEIQTMRRMEPMNMAGETPTSRWGHIHPLSEKGQTRWSEVKYPSPRRAEEAESSTQSPSHPDLGQNTTDADGHGSDIDPQYTWCSCSYGECSCSHEDHRTHWHLLRTSNSTPEWYFAGPNHRRQMATWSEAVSTAEAHDASASRPGAASTSTPPSVNTNPAVNAASNLSSPLTDLPRTTHDSGSSSTSASEAM